MKSRNLYILLITIMSFCISYCSNNINSNNNSFNFDTISTSDLSYYRDVGNLFDVISNKRVQLNNLPKKALLNSRYDTLLNFYLHRNQLIAPIYLDYGLMVEPEYYIFYQLDEYDSSYILQKTVLFPNVVTSHNLDSLLYNLNENNSLASIREQIFYIGCHALNKNKKASLIIDSLYNLNSYPDLMEELVYFKCLLYLSNEAKFKIESNNSLGIIRN